MDELCTVSETKATYKHYDAVGRAAVPCEGYEDSDADLLQSLALELYVSCSAWCIYDYASSGELAWKWNNNNLCWDLLNWGSCHYDYSNKVNNKDWEIMKERVNSICTQSPTTTPTTPFPTNPPTTPFPTIPPPTTSPTLPPPTVSPTTAPSCIPHQEWSADLMDELCTVSETKATYKHYDAVGRAAVPCEGYEDSDADLLQSLALELYVSCSAWCVYDYASSGEKAWKWNNNLCWDLLDWGSCHYDYQNSVINENWEIMKERVNAICTLSPTTTPTIPLPSTSPTTPSPTEPQPTSTPTTCEPHYTWSEERATELCPSDSAGQADKSFGVLVCSNANSIDKQEALDETLANQFYTGCSSWCLYDYDTLINNVRTGSIDQGGFKWNNNDNCYDWVTAFSCFERLYNEFEEIMSFARLQCAAQ